MINEAGGYPTRNFSTGQFDGCQKISGETQAELENARGGEGSATHGCHRGCVIRCSGTFYDKNGRFLTKQPEYETVWAHGGNCGIDDLDAIAQIDRLDDDYGVDTIEMGATIAVAMEGVWPNLVMLKLPLIWLRKSAKAPPGTNPWKWRGCHRQSVRC